MAYRGSMIGQCTFRIVGLITNKKGDCISSDHTINSDNLNEKQIVFAKKILSYAEIALGIAV